MRRELLIAAGPGEWRAAFLEDGEPAELRVERADGYEIGSIHRGRVTALLPALGAALVDIGGERPAFLPQSEVFPRRRRIDAGAAIIVQIRREPQGGKAAQLTTAVRLRGHLVELTAGRPGFVGTEILSPEDHTRLAAEAGAALGLRLRNPADIETLAQEVQSLRGRWNGIGRHATMADPPVRLYPPGGHAAALAAALPQPEQVLVDMPAAVPEIRAAFQGATIAAVPQDEWPVDLDSMFDAALSPTVMLAGGGALHFEPAAAATLIDVDSGSPAAGSPERTALATNLAAAAAIGRQMRLRNLAGGIVVDFVGLDQHRGRERVRAALAVAVAADPLQPQILGWTRLGHLELVRRRRSRPLADLLLEPAAPVKTAATLAYEALRALARAARAEPGRAQRLVAAPDVAAALAGEAAAALGELEHRLGRTVAIAVDSGLPRRRFQLAPL